MKTIAWIRKVKLRGLPSNDLPILNGTRIDRNHAFFSKLLAGFPRVRVRWLTMLGQIHSQRAIHCRGISKNLCEVRL
jgi:hypothetical protein